MIALGLLATLAAPQDAQVRIIESVDPQAGRAVIQAVIKLPEMSPREWGALHVIREALVDGTKGYTGTDIMRYVTAVGDPVKVSLASDHVRIGFSMPPANLSIASDVLEELLDKAYLQTEKVQTLAEELPFRRTGYWEASFTSWRPDFSKLRHDEVLRVYRRVFQPSRTTIAITGSFAKGTAEKIFTDRFASWNPEDPGRRRILEGAEPKRQTPPGPTVTHLSAEMDRPLPDIFLCAYALGYGKGSSAFRVVREELRHSYRQEAFISPHPSGWRLSLVFPHSGAIDRSKVIPALKKDIEAWDDATLARAKGMMAGTFDLSFGGLPIMLNPAGVIGTNLDDRTYWRAYAASKGGTPGDLDALRDAAAQVDLEGLKATAMAWVEKL